MADARRLLAYSAHPAFGVLAALTGLALAVALGTAIGYPTPGGTLLLLAAVGIPLAAFIFVQPFAGFLIIAGSVVCLAVFAVNDDNYLNGIDAMLPIVLPLSLVGRQWVRVREEDAAEAGPGHDAIRAATRRFTNVVLVYLAAAALSLVNIVARIGGSEAVQSGTGIVRVFEGAMLFPLGLMWIRTERQIRYTITALMVASAVLTAVNVVHVLGMHDFRGGITWVLNKPDWPLESPNEGGAVTVMIGAIVLAWNAVRPRAVHFVILALLFLTLFMTQSRSSLLSLAIFGVMTVRRVRARYVVAAIVVFGLVLLLAPSHFWVRMMRSVTLEKGSYEVYSGMIRVYGYICSIRAFLDNWVIGLGYLAGRYVSDRYNELRITGLGSENFFLETAVGMGIIGFGILVAFIVRLFQLGRAVLRWSPPGTLGHGLAAFHAPLIVSIMSICLVGDQWVGMVGVGQLALWCALMTRAGHLALKSPPA